MRKKRMMVMKVRTQIMKIAKPMIERSLRGRTR
jgi:hypothetical protein